MSFEPGVWGRNARIWVPGLVFLLLNGALLLAYRVALAEEADMGRARLARRADELDALREERRSLADVLERAAEIEKGLDDFYTLRLATENVALTRIIAEVKDLSRRAGLVPAQIDYAKETFKEEDLLRRSIEFPVDGDYAALRRLVNFLELSDSFLVLESVGLRGENENTLALNISLQIATFFATGSTHSRGVRGEAAETTE
ncbi:MAG: hypothetical protein OES47_00145 [Acidobacteriota bacterium]|nr:hypothetical protein [Acidobacteriota bacterium]